jgi:hypothetical protein
MEHKKAIAVEKKAIAVEIALQTHVLKACPEHNEIFCDDDVDPSSAFALAVDLVKQHTPYVDEFEGDAHELTDLLSATIGDAPRCCPVCTSARVGQNPRVDQNPSLDQNRSAEQVMRAGPSGACERGGLGQGLLQGWHVVGLGQQEHTRPARAEDELHVQPVTG